MPDNVPLPDNVTFQFVRSLTRNGQTGTQWVWLVNGSTPEGVYQFYQDHLQSLGWINIRPQNAIPDELEACQGNKALIFLANTTITAFLTDAPDITTTAPSGGSVLMIILGDNPLYPTGSDTGQPICS